MAREEHLSVKVATLYYLQRMNQELIVAFLLGRKQFIESMTHAAIKG